MKLKRLLDIDPKRYVIVDLVTLRFKNETGWTKTRTDAQTFNEQNVHKHLQRLRQFENRKVTFTSINETRIEISKKARASRVKNAVKHITDHLKSVVETVEKPKNKADRIIN